MSFFNILSGFNFFINIWQQFKLKKIEWRQKSKNDALNLAGNSSAEFRMLVGNKKIEALDMLWVNFLSIREKMPHTMYWTDILYKNEIPEFLTGDGSSQFSHHFQFIDEIKFVNSSMNRQLAHYRPYISLNLWSLFSTYQAIIYRSAHLMSQAYGKPPQDLWLNDSQLNDLLKIHLTERQISELKELDGKRFIWLEEQFDILIFKEINYILMGKEENDISIQQYLVNQRKFDAATSAKRNTKDFQR